MRSIGVLISLLTVVATVVGANAQPGDPVWATHFDTPDSAGTGGGILVKDEGRGRVLEVDNEDASRTVVRSFALPVEKMRGRFAIVRCEVKADSVSPKPQPWNGVKVMVRIDTANGTQWPQAEIAVGAFDWKRFSKRVLVPEDAKNATLVLGLEAVTGKVWFGNVQVTLAEPALAPAAPADQPIFTGHSVPRLRGAMINPDSLTQADLHTLAIDWGANLVRWQLVRWNTPDEQNSFEAYDEWLDERLQKLDQGIAWAKSMGVMVVVDLHSPPGGEFLSAGYQGASGGIFNNPAAQAKLVDVWRKIAARYKGEKQIWAFELMNEPVDDDTAEGCDDWQTLALRAGEAIRKIDPDRTLIVDAPADGAPEGFVGFRPVPLARVVYTFHMYIPYDFTYQHPGAAGAPLKYPGIIGGRIWDKIDLQKAMLPAIEFCRRYRVQMYVGEFSAIRWAPGGENYLADLISIFEANHWDWSYHAFREWQGWNAELGDDRNNAQPTTKPTDRQMLLTKWFKQNARAG